MTIVPLAVDGENRTVVTHPDQFKRDGTATLIQNLDEDQLTDEAQCNVSYDLRVGEKYRDHRDKVGRSLADEEEIRVRAGMAVIIQTEEFVSFPNTLFGQIAPKVDVLQTGIANTPSKVDPGYPGHLLITVFNHGRRTVKLKCKQPFCSLFVSSVGEGVRPYSKIGIVLETSKPPRQRLRLLLSTWLQTLFSRWLLPSLSVVEAHPVVSAGIVAVVISLVF